MITLNARNAHQALPAAINLLRSSGIREDSRNGPVLRAPVPVCTVLSNPLERLTFHEWRDSNPFFLCIEALWMLAGRNDLKQLTPFVKRMADYSDDGGHTQPGAYGKRWRGWFVTEDDETLDQLDWAVKRLRANPGDRRVVISMWDANMDPSSADRGSKDVPCNLMILPWVANSELHLTIFNRSNDIIWGLYSANAVQFSTLLEYLAARIGLRVGTMTTISNNFHMYEATAPSGAKSGNKDPYETGLAAPPSLLGDWTWAKGDAFGERVFQEDLAMLFEYGAAETQLKARSPYLRRVVLPLVLAHKHWRTSKSKERYEEAYEILDQMPACDWRLAARDWLAHRELRAMKREAA